MSNPISVYYGRKHGGGREMYIEVNIGNKLYWRPNSNAVF